MDRGDISCVLSNQIVKSPYFYKLHNFLPYVISLVCFPSVNCSLLYLFLEVACTNWKRLWMLLTGRSNASSPLDIPSAVPHQLGAVKRLSDMHNVRNISDMLHIKFTNEYPCATFEYFIINCVI